MCVFAHLRTIWEYRISSCVLFVWLLGVNCLATIAYLSLEFFFFLLSFWFYLRIEYILELKSTNE